MRSTFWCVLFLSLFSALPGCGGVTEKEKEAAEKVPDLDVGAEENKSEETPKP